MPSSTTHSAKSSSRTLDSQIEILYNTAVQSFVRRDHSTTQANLARLTKLLKTQLRSRNEAWYDLDAQVHKEDELESWIIKTLKLVISSLASLYTDPPSNTSRLPNELKALLPPSPPEDMLAHIHNTCAETYFSASSPEPRLLPPPLLSTLLLAALKLSLPFTHRFAEDWLALLPDAFIFAISPNSNVAQKAEKRVEAAREGYLKVVELFVSEVLAREEEWEMARGFLEGEAVMGSKRKENLYRHLRALQTKPRSNPSSPAYSGILSSSTEIATSPSPKPNGRSRSNSSSSSSSERTARPTTTNGLPTSQGPPILNGLPGSNGVNGVDRKGKSRSSVLEEERSESSVPRRIYVNHPSTPSRSGLSSTPARARMSGLFDFVLALLPQNMQNQLAAMSKSEWLASTLAIPIPIIIMVVTFLSIRRRLARRRETVVAGTATLAAHAIDDVRARLMRARGQGVLQWVGWWLRWWAGRFAGIWKMGTTITMV